MIFSYAQFGYEGSLVRVETDLRNGIPAMDLVGLADGKVKESREIIRHAISSSGYEMPSKRILLSLSPADLHKDETVYALPMALDIMSAQEREKTSYQLIDEDFLVLGDLNSDGSVKPVKNVYPAVLSASAAGISKIIVPKENVTEALNSASDIRVCGVDSFSDAYGAMHDDSRFIKKRNTVTDSDVQFHTDENLPPYITADGHAVETMVTAVAGRHNLLLAGAAGSGKTYIAECAQYLQPYNNVERSQSVTRIYSIAGLMPHNAGLVREAPFRMPHETISIEGMCGGGYKLMPGEISLAHNGILFLSEAQDFRQSILNLLPVPQKSGTVTLARAGRSTVYPADFNLFLTVTPPDYRDTDHPDMYLTNFWNKFPARLLRDMDICSFVSSDDSVKKMYSTKALRSLIAQSQIKQYERQGKLNGDLTNNDLSLINKSLDINCSKAIKEFIKDDPLHKELPLLTVARTIADISGHEKISLDDVRIAASYTNVPVADITKYKNADDYYDKLSNSNKLISISLPESLYKDNTARSAAYKTQAVKTAETEGVSFMEKNKKEVSQAGIQNNPAEAGVTDAEKTTEKRSYPEIIFDSVMTHLEKGDSVLLEDHNSPSYPKNMYSNAVYTGLNAVSIMQGLRESGTDIPYVATMKQLNFNNAKVKSPEQNDGKKVKSVGTAYQWVKELHYSNDVRDEKDNVIHSKGAPVLDKSGNIKSGNIYFSLYSVGDALDIEKKFNKSSDGKYIYDHYEIKGPTYKESDLLPKKLPSLVSNPGVEVYKAVDGSIDEKTMQFLSANFRNLYNGGKAEKGSPELFADMRKTYTGREFYFMSLASKADAFSRSDVRQVSQIQAKQHSKDIPAISIEQTSSHTR